MMNSNSGPWSLNKGCGPDCPENKRWPSTLGCTCNKPLLLYIPPGHHVHMCCPVHGDYVIRGSDITCSVTS